MDANQFLQLFHDALPATWEGAAVVPAAWSQWTGFIVGALHKTAHTGGLSCCCQYSHSQAEGHPSPSLDVQREVLFDFTWYASADDYALPVVAIEHENGSHPQNLIYDLWKLMFAYVPLRVMIGYVPDESVLASRLNLIEHVASTSHWHYPAMSEDLILIGTDLMTTPRSFTVLHRALGADRFASRGALAAPQASSSATA